MSRRKTGNLEAQVTSDPEGHLAWQQEKLILSVTERMCELMEVRNVSRAELARQLGTSNSYVARILDGTQNMTLRTVSNIFTLLGHELVLGIQPLTKSTPAARRRSISKKNPGKRRSA